MPSENKTPNYGLNQWQGNEYVKRQDFVADNLIIDKELKNLDNRVISQTGQIGTISENIKIKTNINILATGWINDTANSGFWMYNIADADITVNTVVDVNIHLADLDKAFSVQSANSSSAGKVTIYASERPTSDIKCDIKIVKQVI